MGEIAMTSKEIERRLQTLEDIESIKKMHACYVNALVATSWDELLENFTDDGTADLMKGFAKGKKEIDILFREKISLTHIGQEACLITQPVISINGDKAVGSWHLLTLFSQPHKMQSGLGPTADADAPDWMSGYYEMEYVKENGQWKINRLKWRRRLLSPRPSVK
jgi:hypothetical protein